MEFAHGWSPQADDLFAREIDLLARWIASRIGDLKLFELKTMCLLVAVRDCEER
jgi:hypothetical protein